MSDDKDLLKKKKGKLSWDKKAETFKIFEGETSEGPIKTFQEVRLGLWIKLKDMKHLVTLWKDSMLQTSTKTFQSGSHFSTEETSMESDLMVPHSNLGLWVSCNNTWEIFMSFCLYSVKIIFTSSKLSCILEVSIVSQWVYMSFWQTLTHGGGRVEAEPFLDILRGATQSRVTAHLCINLVVSSSAEQVVDQAAERPDRQYRSCPWSGGGLVSLSLFGYSFIYMNNNM